MEPTVIGSAVNIPLPRSVLALHIFCPNEKDGRHRIQNIRLEPSPNGKGLRAHATDGHRLTTVSWPFADAPPAPIDIPHNVAKDAMRGATKAATFELRCVVGTACILRTDKGAVSKFYWDYNEKERVNYPDIDRVTPDLRTANDKGHNGKKSAAVWGINSQHLSDVYSYTKKSGLDTGMVAIQAPNDNTSPMRCDIRNPEYDITFTIMPIRL